MGRPLLPVDPDSPGGKVRAARIARGLDQPRASAMAGVPVSFLSDVERGRRAPTLEWLRDFADAIGVPRSGLSPDLADRPPAPSKKKGRGA